MAPEHHFSRSHPITPKKAVLKFCRACVGKRMTKNCGGNKVTNMLERRGSTWVLVTGVCQFYAYRTGEGRPKVREIRSMCLYCMGGSYKEVRECDNTNCPLHPFRMGTNPNRKREE